MIHILLHFLVPLIISYYFFGSKWLLPWLIMSSTILVDMDHLLANPVYDPNRCSIGFHPLHHPIAIIVYALLFLFPKTRLIAAGLLIHMALDYLDCLI